MVEEIKIDRLEELIHEMMIKIRNTSVTNSAEGNPIEIENAAAAPLLKCVSAITGSQNLHGYDKPWVGGAGENKLPLVLDDIKSANTSGTWSGSNYTESGVTYSVETDNGGNVTGIRVNGTATASAYFYVAKNLTFGTFDNSYIVNGGVNGGGDSTFAIQVYSDISGLFANVYDRSDIRLYMASNPSAQIKDVSITIRNGYTANNLLFKPMIRLSTVTDPTYAPYSNICPITVFSTGSVEVEDEDEQSTTYAATFTNPIYQGSIDFVAKKTTATWGYIASYDGETLPGCWISDRDEYAAGTTPTTGAEVAYELASAAVETVTVSNAPVSAVHSYNKIESSTGDMEVTYITEDFEPLVPTT